MITLSRKTFSVYDYCNKQIQMQYLDFKHYSLKKICLNFEIKFKIKIIHSPMLNMINLNQFQLDLKMSNFPIFCLIVLMILGF